MTLSSFTAIIRLARLAVSASVLGCCFAFIPPPTFASSPLITAKPTSSVVLFASNRKGAKRKKTLKAGGGQGFGSASASRPTTTTSSAARTAKNNKPQVATARRQKGSQRCEDYETATAETALLKTIYTEQFHQQQERCKRAASLRSKLVQVSHSPLMFTIDDFIDPEACARVHSNGAGCFDLCFPELVSDLLFNGQESELDGLLFNEVSSADHPTDHAYPDGVHMDTNGQCQFRHVTAILYLNDVPEDCGGATVFPLARALPNDPALAASRRLLAVKISHTRSGIAPTTALEADAQLIETRVGTNFGRNPNKETGIRIQPKAGRLLLFFSRYDNGEEDPRAWHAGERIRDSSSSESEYGSLVTKKRILTLFKQVDYAASELDQHFRVETTFESFLAPQIQKQQKWLQEKARAQQQ